MSVRGIVAYRSQTLDATGLMILANANFLFLLSATAPITIQLLEGGTSSEFDNVQAGLSVGRVKNWSLCRITGAQGTVVTLFYGYTDIKEDTTTFQAQIATIAGNVQVRTVPAASVTDTAPVVTVAATQAALFPANAARRRVRVFSDPNNAGDTQIFFRKAGGANDIGFVVPGVDVTFEGTYGIDYRAVNGGDKLYIFEEN